MKCAKERLQMEDEVVKRVECQCMKRKESEERRVVCGERGDHWSSNRLGEEGMGVSEPERVFRSADC